MHGVLSPNHNRDARGGKGRVGVCVRGRERRWVETHAAGWKREEGRKAFTRGVERKEEASCVVFGAVWRADEKEGREG